jgi:hypothetical protein
MTRLEEIMGGKDFYGGRFPPDGAYFATGRRIDPCSVCDCESFTMLQEVDESHPHRLCKKGGQILWLCEKHEKEYYKLWAKLWAKRNSK